MQRRTNLPLGLGPIHFIGIGGIGMSAIAEILLGYGHSVQGSDAKGSAITERLERLGARVFVGHDAANLGEAAVVVASTAIKRTNPEMAQALARGLPVVRRAEMLAELMRLNRCISVAGTHGKTTTTTMMAAMLEAGGLDPTVINGGIIHAYGSNAKAGQGAWLVAEADESDGSFNLLPTEIAVVTNIDPEHMDHWRDFDALRAGFDAFLNALPFYGLAALCTDHPEVAALAARVKRPVVTFGFNEGANLRAIDLTFEKGQACFDIAVNWRGECRKIDSLTLPMPGNHNVSNALSAVAVALHLGLSDDQIRAALAGFQGVGRRFTRVGEVGGVTIIDDYGHHPVEIAAVIQAARQSIAPGAKVIAVHQPHRFTRLSSLFDDFARCFDGADVAAIAEVYSAGEDPIAGADRDTLVAAMQAHGHANALALSDQDSLTALVATQARPGDIVVCLGAGTISAWAHALPGKLGTAA